MLMKFEVQDEGEGAKDASHAFNGSFEGYTENWLGQNILNNVETFESWN